MPLRSTRGAAALLLFCWPALACQARPGTDAAGGARSGPATQTPPRDARPGGAPEDPFAAVPRMTVEEAAEAVKAGRAVMVDVRPAEAYAEERIKGALSLPEEDVPARGGELPKDKLVVVYCA
ncbi:MAG TPA: rhodanese-like domain-containing protein [Pyrinomonadaceae bacterium]|nr:rhodanese-like domain-containing protein [Pyrinomonadaceae bacterium]